MAKAVYRGANTGRGPSPNLWYACDWKTMCEDPNLGYTFFDDFLKFLPVAAATTAQDGYVTFVDTGCSIARTVTEVGGVATLTTDGSDNDSVGIDAQPVGKISSSDPKKLWWEARIRFGQIVTQDFYIGLAEEGLCVDDGVFADAGTIGDKDYVGFRILEADSDGLDAIHNDATGEIVVQNEAQVIVADTWYKVGCYFDGTVTHWYVDGAKVGAVAGVLPTATDFPDGEEMGLLILVKEGAAAAKTVDIDWWRFAQEA